MTDNIYEEKIAVLEAELRQTRLDAGKVVHALDCAVQVIEGLIKWLPEGMTLPESVTITKANLDRAMQAITGRIVTDDMMEGSTDVDWR